MRKKTIKLPIYHGTVTIIQVDRVSDIAKKYDLDMEAVVGMEACFFSKNTSNGFTRYFLVFEEGISTGVIAHECLHAVNQVFTDRSMEVDPYNDEPMAYLLGFLVDECYWFLNPKVKPVVKEVVDGNEVYDFSNTIT